MSHDPFAEDAAGAAEDIEELGRFVELFKLDETPEDATKPWEGSSKKPHLSKKGAGIPVKMVFVPARGSGFGRLLTNEGTLKISYSQVGLLAGDSVPSRFKPEDVRLASMIVDGDQVWSIVTRGELRPSNLTVLFVLGLERSA